MTGNAERWVLWVCPECGYYSYDEFECKGLYGSHSHSKAFSVQVEVCPVSERDEAEAAFSRTVQLLKDTEDEVDRLALELAGLKGDG